MDAGTLSLVCSQGRAPVRNPKVSATVSTGVIDRFTQGRKTVRELGSSRRLSQLNRRKLAALVGVAPFNCDSGTLRARRHCWGGRADLRAVLYMTTVTALRCNPVIRAFYQRLLRVGKPKKLAITACMRKLLTILNAMVRDNAAWNPTQHVVT
jgi:transposase